MKEIWNDIKGYENIYEVSNMGRIRTSKGKTTFTKKHGVRHWKQRIIKNKGYTPKTGFRVSLWKNGEHKDYLVSRLVAFTFYDKDINNRKLTVNHINGNRMDNDLNNLELISLADNIRHAFETGLMTTCKQTVLISKISNESKTFYSMSKADQYMNYAMGYISNKVKRGKYENDKFKWIIKESD